ncbi:MAG: phosphatidate cytidylyltransferase [Lachnospiraceae bacterium]
MFFKRLCSSIVIVIVTLAVNLIGGPVLAAELLLISLIGLCEYNRAVGVGTQEKGMNLIEAVTVFGSVVFYVTGYFAKNLERYLLLVIVVVFVLLMTVYVFSFPKYEARQVIHAFFGFIYVPVMLSFIYFTRNLQHGEYTVWLIFIGSWICDTCAYCTGMLFGRHKLAPVLSPKKSIEGSIGGIVGAALVAAAFAYFLVESMVPNQKITWLFVTIGVVGAVVSQIGDLAASAIKRNHGIKDYGNVIPGHGGILDRYDSVIFTAPMIYFLAVIFMH